MKLVNRIESGSGNPFSELQNEIENLVTGMFGERPGSGTLSPRADIGETENEYSVTLELPGVAEAERVLERVVVREAEEHVEGHVGRQGAAAVPGPRVLVEEAPEEGAAIEAAM